jgi:hypothetical protein
MARMGESTTVTNSQLKALMILQALPGACDDLRDATNEVLTSSDSTDEEIREIASRFAESLRTLGIILLAYSETAGIEPPDAGMN